MGIYLHSLGSRKPPVAEIPSSGSNFLDFKSSHWHSVTAHVELLDEKAALEGGSPVVSSLSYTTFKFNTTDPWNYQLLT